MPLPEISTFLRDMGVVCVSVGAIGTPLYRWVLRPKVVIPAQKFFADVRTGIDTINRIDPIVKKMEIALGPNGGTSLADVIHRTAGRVNLILDSHTVPTWEASMDGRNTRVNPAFEILTGYSAADLRGNGWKNILHDDDAEDYFDAWDSAIRDVRQFKYPRVRFVTRDGRVVPVSVVATPATFGQGSTTYFWMGSVHVISLNGEAR